MTGPDGRQDTSAEAVAFGVPAYVSPIHHPGEWAGLAGLPAGSIVIVNPDSGPHPDMGRDYAEAVATLRRAGVQVYGYATLSYGERSYAALARDVDRYREALDIDGVFLDQAASDHEALRPALALADHHRRAGIAVAVNPGQPLMPSVAFTAFDAVVTFEGSVDDYLAFDATPHDGWTAKDWHLVYGVPAHECSEILDLAARRGAHYAFASTGHLPNPWGSILDVPVSEAVR